MEQLSEHLIARLTRGCWAPAGRRRAAGS